MPTKEQKLQVALGHLMDNLPYNERDEIPDFIRSMPSDGVNFWLNWAQDAISHRKARNELVYRLQQKMPLRNYTPHAMHRMINHFSDEGINTWLKDIDEGTYPLAVLNKEKPYYPEIPQNPEGVFHNLLQEIVWVQQHVTPALYAMEGMEPMIQNLISVAYGQSQLDTVGIHNGKLFVPQNGTYTQQEAQLYCPFDYERVSAGLVLSDYTEDFAVLAFHSQPRITERIPARTQFSLMTTQDPELLNLQQLRMQFYDISNRPCTSARSYTVVGDFTTLIDGNIATEEMFLLKQHPEKQLFYRDLQ